MHKRQGPSKRKSVSALGEGARAGPLIPNVIPDSFLAYVLAQQPTLTRVQAALGVLGRLGCGEGRPPASIRPSARGTEPNPKTRNDISRVRRRLLCTCPSAVHMAVGGAGQA